MNSVNPMLRVGRFEPRLGSSGTRFLLCFSHLRWNFVYQRPQHLLSEAAKTFTVLFVEEPEFARSEPHWRLKTTPSNVLVLTPVIDPQADPVQAQRQLVEGLQRSLHGAPLIHWFLTPMALQFARGLDHDFCVYDCMDELAAFRFAPPDIVALEQELLTRADLVFTGGPSLYAARRRLHPDVHCFPSSVDVPHFGRARAELPDPSDQAAIPAPRIGYVGVIDERIDLELIATSAAALQDVQFVMVGPIAKIDPAALPQARNIHWLGRKDYAELPGYMANWQAAWMPFALNEATRFISPTKTPEYLAAGLRVTATAVTDVVEVYGDTGLVAIADRLSMPAALRASLEPPPPGWLSAVDDRLASTSWSRTWRAMQDLIASRMAAVAEVAHV